MSTPLSRQALKRVERQSQPNGGLRRKRSVGIRQTAVSLLQFLKRRYCLWERMNPYVIGIRVLFYDIGHR